MQREIIFKLTPPEGYEVDKEKSTFDNIVYRLKGSNTSNNGSVEVSNKEKKKQDCDRRYDDKYYDDKYQELYRMYNGDDYGWIKEYVDRMKRVDLPCGGDTLLAAHTWHRVFELHGWY